MTPHYDWTPASEPPDTRRLVSVWCCLPGQPLETGWPDCCIYLNEQWTMRHVTHWRDVEPPDVEAPK